MTGDLSQDDRTGSLATPLGKDVLVLSRFEGATFSVTSAAVSIAGPTLRAAGARGERSHRLDERGVAASRSRPRLSSALQTSLQGSGKPDVLSSSLHLRATDFRYV